MPTVSVENYLKSIYHLQQREEGPVGTKAIADRLQVSLASVTRMLKTLAESHLLDYEPYKGARLTARGEREALRTIRHHRLAELFLMKTLGFSWDEVHREAEALEHALSDKVANRIDAYLGFPQTDPHGDPIPGADGTMHSHSGVGLTEMRGGQRLVVRRVLDQRSEVLRYLGEHHIQPGAVIEIVRQEPFEGPLTVLVCGNTFALSKELAERILVEAEG